MSSPPTKKRKKGNRRTDEIEWKKHASFNKKLTDILAEVGTFEKIQGHKAKAKAYDKAVKALTSYNSAVTSGEEAKNIDGIGLKISAKIDEILSTGGLKKLDKLNADKELVAIRLLQRVSGIGPSAAIKWVRNDGVRTLEDLQKQKLNGHQSIGLKYFKDFEERIPRAEVEELEKIVLKEISLVSPLFLAKTCGSYRRGRLHSGDIDILITHPSFTEATKSRPNTLLEGIINKLTETSFLTDHLSKGSMKYMGVCQLPKEQGESVNSHLHRRIDIRLVPQENFWCGLLYFTGSDYFNTQMRIIALEKGFTLNEYSLVPIGETGVTGKPLEVTCEEDVFDMLNMTYKVPQQRDL